jgi:RecA-family ATPase
MAFDLEEIRHEADVITRSLIQPATEQDTYTAAELFNLDADAIPYLIEPIIPKVGVFSIVGSSDTGKSMLFRQLSLCIAREQSFLDFTVSPVHRKVMFIATEDDNVSTGFLLRKQAQSSKALDNIRFHFETENIPEYLEVQISIEPVDLIVIDAWSDVFGQNLNDSALIRATLNIYRSIANKHQCAIGFLHHTGKRTQKLVPSKDNILSGQGFEAKMRLVMELRSDISDSDYKHLCIVKGNYLGKEYKNSSYKLHLDSETFLFTNTGERVPFEDLAEPSEDRQKAAEKVQAHDVNNDLHKKYLIEIYKGKDSIRYADLWKDISSVYSKQLKQKLSRETAQAFLRFLETEGFIEQQGTPGTKGSVYKINEYMK